MSMICLLSNTTSQINVGLRIHRSLSLRGVFIFINLLDLRISYSCNTKVRLSRE